MKNIIASIFFILFSTKCVYAQDGNSTAEIMGEYFSTIEGSWEAVAKDSSFISVLTYNRGEKQYFVYVDNDLLTRGRSPLSHYEGYYFFNPNNSRIEFTTVSNNEIHQGHSEIKGDTLYHYATIKGGSSSVNAYASAIVLKDKETMAYYASYSHDEKVPKLTFERPLIYRRVENEDFNY